MQKNHETQHKKSRKIIFLGRFFGVVLTFARICRQVFGQIFCSRAPGLTASIPMCFKGGNYLKISESKSQQELIKLRAHTNN
jgi:hypothetical protein